MMARLLPIWATTIIFWTTYAQMITFSVEQASTMERSIGNFQIPAGSLTVFFVAAILITLAVYDRIIMPLWKKWKGKPGITFMPFKYFELLSIVTNDVLSKYEFYFAKFKDSMFEFASKLRSLTLKIRTASHKFGQREGVYLSGELS